MDNKGKQNNKVSVEEILKRREERNNAVKSRITNKGKKRNEILTQVKRETTTDNVLGKVDVDLQLGLAEAEHQGLLDAEAIIDSQTEQIVERLYADADAEADLICSADEEVYDVDFVEVEDTFYKLPERKSRFGKTSRLLSGSSNTSNETRQIESSKPKKNMFDV